MADTKYSALTQIAPTAGDTLGIAQTGTSFGATVSSLVFAGSTQINALTTSNTANEGVLFNNAGVVSSDALFEYHYSTQTLALGGTSSAIFLTANPAIQVTTAASTMAIYGKQIVGSMRVTSVGPLGDERPYQRSLYDDTMALWSPTTSAPGRVIAGDSVTFGTYSSAAATVGSAYTTRKRGVYFSSTGAAGQTAGVQLEAAQYFQGSTSGYGGWFFFCRFGLDTWATSTRYLVGMTAAASSAVCTSNPSSLANTCGFMFNDNVTTWGFFHSSNSAVGTTETFSGQTGLATGNGYDIYIHAPANTTRIYYRMDELNTGSTVVNSSVANFLPNSTTFLRPVAMAGTLNASSGVARIGIIKLYVETTI